MAQPMLDIANVWKLLGTKGNQLNPTALAQMAQQAAPNEDNNIPQLLRVPQAPTPPYLDAQMPMSEPPPPQVTPVESAPTGPYTAQPTTSPLGTVAQEIQPAQPAIMSPWDKMNQELLSRYDKMKLPPNASMLKELDVGTQNFSEGMRVQQDDINKMKEGLAKYTSQKPGINFTPLAALSDAWYGGNLTEAAKATAPETMAQRQKNIADMQAKIVQAQGEIPKAQLDLMKTKLVQMGYMDERAQKMEIAKMAAMSRMASSGQAGAAQAKRATIAEKRLDTQIDREARNTANNDPSLKQFMPRLEGAAKVGELIQSARDGKVVSNQALLGQLNAEIARLETGSQAPGLHAAEKTELLDARAQVQSIVDQVTGNPQDAVRPEVLNAAGKLVDELTVSYMKGIDSRMEFLKAGMTPEQAAIMDKKHISLKTTYAPRFGHWDGQAVGPEIGVVVEGHTYLGGDPANPASWRAK